MRKTLIILILMLSVFGLMAQTHTATQHRSTESIRLKDVTITDIVDTVSNQSTDHEIPTAKAVYNSLGNTSSVGSEFHYFQKNDITPDAGYGYFHNDTIIINLTDQRGIDVNDAINGAVSVNVRSATEYVSYTISSIEWNDVGRYYFLIIDVGKGTPTPPAESASRYLTFVKSNIITPPDDTTINAGLLGFEFQYTESVASTPTEGTVYAGNDTISLWKKDRRDISITNIIPTASHIRVRNDSIMTAYEIQSYKLINNDYYRILINTGKGTPDIEHGQTITFVSFIFSTGTSTGLEKITEGGNTGWRLIGRNPDYYGDIGNEAVDLSYNNYSSIEKGATGDYSLAFGKNATASGSNSIALGGQANWTTRAEGTNSLALIGGWASGTGSISIGYSKVTGLRSASFACYDGYVSGDYSISTGYNINVTGDYSFGGGYATTTSGQLSVDGDYSFSYQYMPNTGSSSVKHLYADKAAVLGGQWNTNTAAAEGSIMLGNNHRNATDPWTTYIEYLMLWPNSTPDPVKGKIYSPTSGTGLYYYNGAAWVDLTASASGISNINDAGDINLSGIKDWSVPKWSSSTGKWIMDIDSTSAGLSTDYQVKLNSSDAIPGYLDTKLSSGDFVSITTSSGTKLFDITPASASDMLARSDINKVVTPDLLPVFGTFDLKTSTITSLDNSATILAQDGLSVRQIIDGGVYKIGYGLATGTLSVKNRLSINFDDYVIVNTNISETVRMKIGELYELLKHTELEMTVLPNLNYRLDGTSGSFPSFTFDRIVEINEWNGSAVSITDGTLSFENEYNCSAVSNSIGSTLYFSVTITVDAGTYTNDGTVYGSLDLVFTDNASGMVVRKKLRIVQNGIIK